MLKKIYNYDKIQIITQMFYEVHMKPFVYNLPQKSVRKDFIFNMFGSLSNAAVSLVLLVVVSRIAGNVAAGIFSLAYSTAQMMYTICVFEMRNIQVTDAKKEFNFGSVFAFRIITTVAMWLFFAVFSCVKGYSGEKLTVMILLSLYMSVMAFSDLFQGNLHINGYLFLAGRSLGIQVCLAATAFSLTLIITKNLVLSAIAMVIAVSVWSLIHDIPFNSNFSAAKPEFKLSVQIKILLCAAPLFLSSFMHQYIFNAPKYAIDEVLTSTEQSHYGYLVMPTFFINLLSIFVFRPQLVPLSQSWMQKNYKKFAKKVALLYAWIAIVTVAAFGAGYLLGIPVLEILYSTDLSGKRGILLILLAAGSFSACCSLTSILITITRKQKYCLVAYIITFAVSLFLPNYLVKKSGISGAAISYLIEMMLLFIIMFIIFIAVFLKHRAKADSELKETFE